jgi:cellulose biosynthesis protein BcsQ
MKTVCFFNNKGGIGKTTLLCNVASYLASSKRKVLVVDADPQCNATQLILEETTTIELYQSATRRHRAKLQTPAVTLFDVLQPIAAGEPTINTRLQPLSGAKNRFGVDLIPGHPNLALLEDKLSQAWLSFGGGDLGGARITNWNTQLTNALTERYDLVFYDVGPSLGALNRSVLVGTDYFLTPMGCDIFSIMGLTNIARWLTNWLAAYEDAIKKCRQGGWSVEEYPIHVDTLSLARFIGYTVQQYITKSIKGKRRATKAYEKILQQIPQTVVEHLSLFFPPHLSANAVQLPDVPHMYSLVPLAQNANSPIHKVGAADGLAGAQYEQQTEYVKFIKELSQSILNNLPKTRGEHP